MGAGFLKVPKDFGNYVQDKGSKHYQGGSLNLIHGSRQFLSKSTFEIKPAVGDFYFFPSYMMHSVYPFKGNDEERRSISFNAFIDDEIHNVYT
jgi:Rps23 Pro-64 3,4-dihydroxylase Tpa1-like proline 4-hydroxylase